MRGPHRLAEDLVRAERLRALRALLAAAARRSPWHRERLAGFDLEAFCEADIASLPVMTKTDLMDNFDSIVTDRRVTRELCERHLHELTGECHLLGEYHVVASAGSSGQRGVFVYEWDARAVCWASMVRFLPATLIRGTRLATNTHARHPQQRAKCPA